MDTRYYIWLAEACGQGTATAEHVLSKYGENAEAVWRATEEELAELEGLPARARAALCDKSLSRAEEILAQCNALHIGVLTTADAAYPNRLRTIPSRPIVLYYFGKLPHLDDHVCIGTVGTRKITSYGERMAYSIAYDLAKGGAIVVSGMAAGIDGICHRAALDAGAHTVAVLGCGLDRVYPAHHRELMARIARGGTLISEYPPGSPPLGSHFPTRNRIISGLSLGTLVVEADLKSGAMITARCATRQGRALYALPGKVGERNSDGVLALLAQGAKLVTCGADILDEYAYLYPHRITISNIPSMQPKHHRSMMVQPIRSVPPQETPREAPIALPFTREAEQVATTTTPAAQKATATAAKRKTPTRKSSTPAKPKRELPVLSDAERKVFDCFQGTPLTADALAKASGEPVSAVLLCLTLLELKGCVRAVAGGAFCSNFTE